VVDVGEVADRRVAVLVKEHQADRRLLHARLLTVEEPRAVEAAGPVAGVVPDDLSGLAGNVEMADQVAPVGGDDGFGVEKAAVRRVALLVEKRQFPAPLPDFRPRVLRAVERIPPDNPTAVLEADGRRVTWSYDAANPLLAENRTGTTAQVAEFTRTPAVNGSQSELLRFQLRKSQLLARRHPDGSRATFAWDAAGNRTLIGAGTSRTVKVLRLHQRLGFDFQRSFPLRRSALD
jgi:YD repeat-containing protein